MPSEDREREERALDALIAWALSDVESGPLPDLSQPEPELLPDDEAALAALPPDLVDRIVNGEWPQRPRKRRSSRTNRDVAVAMNRSEDGDDLTDKAREEMEQRLRELEEGSNDEEADDADDRIQD